MKKIIDVVFIDDLSELIRNQEDEFERFVVKYAGPVSKEEKRWGFSFCGVPVFVSSEEVLFSMENNSIPDNIIDQLTRIRDAHSSNPTLYVIDLCLDDEDKRTGQAVKEFLLKDNNMHDYFFVTANAAFYDDDNTILRAVSDSVEFDNNHGTSIYCKIFPEKEEEYSEYSSIIDLLKADFTNDQYFGAVLFKIIDLVRKHC